MCLVPADLGRGEFREHGSRIETTRVRQGQMGMTTSSGTV